MFSAAMSKGIYFLANNQVLDLVVAFLNSFRRFNPDIPLCLIPFDDDVDQIASLSSKSQFSVYRDSSVLAECDEISLRFHDRTMGHYRKLACWHGEFDEFIYIDVDTVVLANVSFAFRFLSEYDFVTSHSNLPQLFEWVWKPSIFSTGQLSDAQIEFSANTGFVCSKRGALEFAEIKEKLQSAVELATHMRLSCKEQPLLNYLIVISGRPYTSLLRLARTKGPRRIWFEHWAGAKGLEIVDGRIMENSRPAPVLLVHWAGEWQPRFIDRFVSPLRKLLRFRKSKKPMGVRLFMPYKELWEYYRFFDDTRDEETNLL